MALLTNSNAIKYRHMGQDVESIPKAETLRDKILKEFLKKQLRTNETLQQHYQSHKDFQKASFEESITANISGLSTFEDFKRLEDSLAVRQVLKSSGLSDDEVKLLLIEQVESTTLQKEKLRVIQNKLEQRQKQLDELQSEPEQFSGAIPLNRHDFEEEINTVPTLEKADRLTDCLVRLKPHTDDTIPTDHPINHIKKIAEELFPSNKTNNDSQYNSTKRKNKWQTLGEYSKKSNKSENKIVYLTEKPKTFWDMKEFPKILTNHTTSRELTYCEESKVDSGICGMIITKKEKVVKHDPSKPFILTLEDADLIPLSTIESNRKTIGELRSMEKFHNWKEGDPSETLYIKNLSHKTTPRDLASLMGNFQSLDGPKISYRVMSGRMRGQAFVTFPDKTAAEAAIKTCNGYILLGKPIVIEYGKQ